MANKLIVVPEEVYSNLVSSSNTVFESGVDKRLHETDAALTKTLHASKLPTTEKYYAYDQGLKQVRNLLTQRNAPSTLESLLSNLLLKTLSAPSTVTTGTLTDADMNLPITQGNTVRMSEASNEQHDLGDTDPTHSSTTSLTADLEPELSRALTTTVKQVKKEPVDHTDFNAGLQTKCDKKDVEKLKQIILERPSYFNVSVDGRVLRTSGKPYGAQNLTASLNYIMGDKTTLPPPGTAELKKRLLKDPVASLIITHKPVSSRSEAIPVNSAPSFKPALWNVKAANLEHKKTSNKNPIKRMNETGEAALDVRIAKPKNEMSDAKKIKRDI